MNKMDIDKIIEERIIEILGEEKIKKLTSSNFDAILGMSGGVDSTASLYFLLESNLKVLGVTLIFQPSVKEEISSAKDIAKKLNVEYIVLDFLDIFEKKIEEYFVSSYLKGLTPNPCAICNRDLKIKILYILSNMLNVSKVATGHYAAILTERENKYIGKAKEPNKEQSYFLGLVEKNIISKLIFPLAEVESKEKLRKYLKEKGLAIASKSDSQDICFVENGKHAEFSLKFLEKYNKENKEIDGKENINKDTNIYLDKTFVKKGKNLFSYTIGQRKGLDISHTSPLYVTDIKVEDNLTENIIIVDEKENLLTNKAKINELNIVADIKKIKEASSQGKLKCKVRHSKEELNCKVKLYKNNSEEYVEIIFSKPRPKVAKGQLVTIYCEDKIYLAGLAF